MFASKLFVSFFVLGIAWASHCSTSCKSKSPPPVVSPPNLLEEVHPMGELDFIPTFESLLPIRLKRRQDQNVTEVLDLLQTHLHEHRNLRLKFEDFKAQGIEDENLRMKIIENEGRLMGLVEHKEL